MEQNLEQTLALLGRTPSVLNALLRDLPEEWTTRNEGGDTWTPIEVVGHLVHCERGDWLSRARIILESGETRTFDKLDRLGHLKESAGVPLAGLLDEYSRLRAKNLEELLAWNLGPAELALRGSHPAFGAVTLSQLLAAWTVHDMTHLHQIARMLAWQYRDTVGPWSAYLGVLHCTGHSGS